jgi:DNA-binding transcriptional ArsR family regulator
MIGLTLTGQPADKDYAPMSHELADIGEAGATERRDLIVEWLEALDPESAGWEAELSAVAMVVVDSLLHSDAQTLQEIGEPVRDTLARLFDGGARVREVRGYLLALLAMTRLGLERLPDPLVVQFPPDSHAAKALQALAAGKPLSSNELQTVLDTSPSQMSRVGRQLLAHGLVVQRRSGRTASWEITPRGRLVAPTPARSRRSRSG